MSPARGAHDILDDVVTDLRAYGPLTSILPEPAAVYAGFPAENRGYPAAVTITAISENSTPMRGVMGKTFRVQATVTATRGWREWYDGRDDQPSSVGQMARLLHLVGNRLDRAEATTGGEIPEGGDGGPQPQELDDGRLALSGDWLLSGWYLDDDAGVSPA